MLVAEKLCLLRCRVLYSYLPCSQSKHAGMSTMGHQVPGVRTRQWNKGERALFFHGRPTAIRPLTRASPILILGASWYLPICQPSAISPGWHHWSVQMPFCRGFAVPERWVVYGYSVLLREYRGMYLGTFFFPAGIASPPLPAARRGQETRDGQACLSITQYCPVLLW